MVLTFTSLEFVFFLGICLAVLHAAGKLSLKIWLLVFFSYVFYVSFDAAGLLVVTFAALVDFFVGRQIGAANGDRARKRWLWVGFLCNFGPLTFFKYSGFLIAIVAAWLHPLGVHLSVPQGTVLRIVGLSYFTFAGISYLLDVYYETMDPVRSLPEYLCYLLYFPKIIAGPIVRAADFVPQLRERFRVTSQDIEVGCTYLLVGAVKKLVIADQLASHVGMILNTPQQYNAMTLVQGMIGYTVQIYADFSGYSDMAIGCARLMGIRFPQNFLMPYSSVNIAEFWRRWHVTMSTWFRDYLFLPLEFRSRGARNPTARASRNIFITMLLCGLWHGASWNFIVWGGLHGLALAVYQVYGRLVPRTLRGQQRSTFYPGKLLSRALTLSVVMVGWIFFGTRTLSVAFQYLWRMLTWCKDGVGLDSPYILPLAAVMALAHLLINKDRNLIEEISERSVPIRVLSYASCLLALTCLVPAGTVPFAYLRF